MTLCVSGVIESSGAVQIVIRSRMPICVCSVRIVIDNIMSAAPFIRYENDGTWNVEFWAND